MSVVSYEEKLKEVEALKEEEKRVDLDIIIKEEKERKKRKLEEPPSAESNPTVATTFTLTVKTSKVSHILYCTRTILSRDLLCRSCFGPYRIKIPPHPQSWKS